MKATQPNTGEAEDLYGEVVSSVTERLLLYLVLGAGYAFLGFFGWVLTL